MDRDVTRASGGAREYAAVRTALLSPRYDVVPRPPPGNGMDMPCRGSNSSGGSVLPALAPAALHAPPPGSAASPNAFKRTGWTTPRSPPGEEPLFPCIDTPPRQRSQSLLDGASMGSVDSDPDWDAFQSARPAPRRPEATSAPDRLCALSPPETALSQDAERNQLAYMEQMYNTINMLAAELEKERQNRAGLEDQAIINRLVTESEYAPLDAVNALTPTLTELDDAAYGVSPMLRSPAASTMSPRSFRPSPPQPHQPKRPIGSNAFSTQLPKDQVELCAALGKNAELRIRTREMERTAEKSSQELEQAQKQMKLAERRISNREEKLRGLLKEKMHWQKELKDMRDQVVEEKMRQVDIFRRMEALKREHTAQLEEMEGTLRDANAENEELRTHVAELRAQQAYQAKRMEELTRQAKEEKESFTAYIAETRQRFKEWKENEASTLRAAREQALSNLKTEYDLKIARHQEEKQKLRDKVKDLEVSLKLMQKDRTLSPLELSLRKATILGSRDNGGTSEAELIESHARIRELETLLEHSQEYQKRQDNIIKVSEATISRLVQEREVTALENLSAHPLTLSPALVGGDDLASIDAVMTGGSPLAPRSPRDIRKPSQYSNVKTGSYDRSKSISLTRPSRSYPTTIVAVPDSVNGEGGRVPPQERKSVRPEPMRVSTLDAVAPITPVVTPKPVTPATIPTQVIPSPSEIPSAKEQYLVNELARLRDELEQVKTRQMQSTVATPQTAECIDVRMMTNDSNKESGPRVNADAAASAKTNESHGSDNIASASAVATMESQGSDAAETQTTEMVNVSPSQEAEARAMTAEVCDEAKPSVSTSTAVAKSEEPPVDQHEPKDATPAPFSEPVSMADTVNSNHQEDMRTEDAEEANITTEAPTTGETTDPVQLLDTAAEDETVALEEGSGDTAHCCIDHADTASPVGSEGSYVLVELLPSDRQEDDNDEEASVDSPSCSEPVIFVDHEVDACVAEDASHDPEGPAENGITSNHEDLALAASTLDEEATLIASSADTTHTNELDASSLIADDGNEPETTEGTDDAEATVIDGDNGDDAQAEDTVLDFVQPESISDAEPVPSDLIEDENCSWSSEPISAAESLSAQESVDADSMSPAGEETETSARVNDTDDADSTAVDGVESAEETTGQLPVATQPFGNEDPTESDGAEESAGSTDVTNTGKVEEPSGPVVEPVEGEDAAEPVAAPAIDASLLEVAPPSIPTDALTALTSTETPESAEEIEAPISIVFTESASAAEDTDAAATITEMEMVEVKSEAALEVDTLSEGEPSTTATTTPQEPDTPPASATNEVLEAAEPEVLGNDTVSDSPPAEESKGPGTESEAVESFEATPSDPAACVDEGLRAEVMMVLAAIVDQCGAEESFSVLKLPEPSNDDVVPPSDWASAVEDATVNSNGDSTCTKSLEEVEDVSAVDELIDPIATGENSGDWDTAEVSDYAEPPSDAQAASDEATMDSVAIVELNAPAVGIDTAVDDDSTSPTEIAGSVDVSDSVDASDALSLDHIASLSHLSEANNSAALDVSDSVDDSCSPSTAIDTQSTSVAVDSEESMLSWIEADAITTADADDTETMIEVEDTSLVAEAENGSTTGTIDLCDDTVALVTPDQFPESSNLDIDASTTAATQDENPVDKIHVANDLAGELRCFEEALCEAILANAVEEVPTRQLTSNEPNLQADEDACDLTERNITANEEDVVASMKNPARDNQSSEEEHTKCDNTSTPSAVVEVTHQELDCHDVENVGDGGGVIRAPSPVKDSAVSPPCSSTNNYYVEYGTAASLLASQAIETALEHYSARNSAETEPVEPEDDSTPFVEPLPEAGKANDITDKFDVVESAVVNEVAGCDAGSEVEAVVSGMVDDICASDEQIMVEEQSPAATEGGKDACTEFSSSPSAAIDDDAADTGPSVSKDDIATSEDTTAKDICVDQLTGASDAELRLPEQYVESADDAITEVHADADTSEKSLHSDQRLLTMAIAEDMMDGVIRHALGVFVRNNSGNVAEDASDHTNDGVVGLEQASSADQSPVTADLLPTEMDAVRDNCFTSDHNTDATSTPDTLKKSVAFNKPPELLSVTSTEGSPISIEAVAQELAVWAAARAVASALVSVEIQLNMGHHADEDEEVHETFDGKDDEGSSAAIPAEMTTPAHAEAPPESAASEVAVAPPDVCQDPGDRNVDDREFTGLIGDLCSAVVAHADDLQMHNPSTEAECEQRGQTSPRAAENVCASEDNTTLCAGSMSESKNATPEMAMLSDAQPSHSDHAPAADEEVCQALHEVVTSVSHMAASSEATNLVHLDAAIPQSNEKETASKSLAASSDGEPRHIAVQDVMNDTMTSLLDQVESTLMEPADTAIADQPSTETLEVKIDPSSQAPPAQTMDEIEASSSTSTRDPTEFPDLACDSEVQSVLSDVCVQVEQSSIIQSRNSNTRNASPLSHRRSSQSVLPTVSERPAPNKSAHGNEHAPASVVENRRTSTRRATKRSGSILAAEQLLAWDISPAVVDATESTVKRYASKRRASRRVVSEPSRIIDHSSGQNPHLLAYDMRNENGELPFSLLDDEMLRVDPNPRRLPDNDEVGQASEIIAKRKKMHYEAYCKSMTQRTTPAFNYAPVYVKFEWSDFVVASPVSPSARPSPVQKLRLLLKKGVRLPCGQYVIVSAFVRPLEDGNENLRVQIYDSERVEEFTFDFFDDHVKKYVAGWAGKDDQAREFVAQLEFRREQGAVIIKLPEKKGLLDANGCRCQSNSGLARCELDESRVGSTIKMKQAEGDTNSEPRTPKTPTRRRVFSTQRPATSPELLPLNMKQPTPQQRLHTGYRTGSDEEDPRDGRLALSVVSDTTESGVE